MDDRKTIQQRLDAISALERALDLRDSGDYKGARAALAACLQVLPDHPEAIALRDELGQGDSSNETFQVSDWLQEERSREAGEPTDQDDLRYQLRQAIGNQEHEKIVSLGEALLTIAGSDTVAYFDQVAASCELLVEQNDPERLDVALGWADTWWRVCQDPRAKDYSRALKGRISTVSHREQRIHEAITAGNLAELMTALHELKSSRDRLRTTDEALTLADASLKDLRRTMVATVEAIEAAIPGRIDEARRLLEEMLVAEPTPANQSRVDDLRAREQALSALHLAIEQALDAHDLTQLEQVSDRLRSSHDQLSTSLHLLERADAAIQRLDRERQANLRAFEGGMAKDLEQAVVALTALRRVDPQHPHCQELPRLERRLRDLEDQHTALEKRLSEHDIRGVHEALRRITTRSDRLSVTPKLVSRAERFLSVAERQARRNRNLVYSITAGALIAIALPLAWWLVDRSAWYAALDQPDPEQRLQAISRYREHPGHFFYGQAALIEQTRLVKQLQDTAWTAALAITDPAKRIPALEAFAKDYAQSQHADKVKPAIAAARQSIDETAYRTAVEIADPIQRITALEAFLDQTLSGAYDQLAVDAIQAARHQDDETRWQAAAARDQPELMIRRLRAYLEDPGLRSHAAEAGAMVAELERSLASDRLGASDRAAWSRIEAADNPDQRLAAVESYLATPEHGLYRSEAMVLVKRLRSEIDAAAWATARATSGPLDERILRLERYIARTQPPPGHSVEARSLLTELRREAERDRWMAASAPGTVVARLARLEAYLDEHPEAAYADDARLLRRQLADQVDYAAYAKALGVLADGKRILALQAYLQGDTNQANGEQARAAIRRSLAKLAEAPLADLALEPPAVLAQLDPALIARLPLDVQQTLSPSALRRLPPADQAALPLSVFAPLPASDRIKVPRQPSWCSRSGVDAIGSWAEVDLRGRSSLRLRLVLAGSLGPDLASPHLWVAETEITQEQWRAIAGSHPSEVEGPQLPVHRITLREAERFITRLADRLDIDRRDPFGPRLPTLEERRFIAATALSGPSADFPQQILPDAERLASIAWFARTSEGKIQDPRLRQPDAWGLYGIFGTVSEWCQSGERAQAMGGHYAATAEACAPDATLGVAADQRDPRVGMRIVFPAR